MNQTDKWGFNVLMYIIRYNFDVKLGFSENEILSLLDKFDLMHRDDNKMCVYDFVKHSNFNLFIDNKIGKRIFSENFISSLISKMDVDCLDGYNRTILAEELKKGLCFDSEELVQKILSTKNKEVIDCVYNYINQIAWKQEELLLFLKKNKLEIKDNILDSFMY